MHSTNSHEMFAHTHGYQPQPDYCVPSQQSTCEGRRRVTYTFGWSMPEPSNGGRVWFPVQQRVDRQAAYFRWDSTESSAWAKPHCSRKRMGCNEGVRVLQSHHVSEKEIFVLKEKFTQKGKSYSHFWVNYPFKKPDEFIWSQIQFSYSSCWCPSHLFLWASCCHWQKSQMSFFPTKKLSIIIKKELYCFE